MENERRGKKGELDNFINYVYSAFKVTVFLIGKTIFLRLETFRRLFPIKDEVFDFNWEYKWEVRESLFLCKLRITMGKKKISAPYIFEKGKNRAQSK